MKRIKKITFENIIETMNESQRAALEDIIQDLDTTTPTVRVVYGEVGAGKTLVAMAAAWYCEKHMNAQAAFMCPTTALARQHARTLQQLRGGGDERDTAFVVSGQNKATSTEHRVYRIKNRKRGIAVGTHALANCDFQNLKLVIIDEQQKFGNGIRRKLVEQMKRTHRTTVLLTATPIPRTIAQIVMDYDDDDDMDDDREPVKISTIDRRAEEKKTIKTSVLYGPRNKDTITQIEKRIAPHTRAGATVLLIAPAIETKTNELIDCKWIEKTFANKKKCKSMGIHPSTVKVLHGRMSTHERNGIGEQLAAGEIRLLIATSIVEVGIHAPGINLAVLFQCERFGMAQIHQIRGRVGRVKDSVLRKRLPPAEFILVAPERSGMSEKTKKRTQSLRTGASGIDLAVEDAIQRGPGEIYGDKQHGYGNKDKLEEQGGEDSSSNSNF